MITRESLDQRQRAMGETLALIDAMKERQRLQAQQDEEKAWTGKLRGRTEQGWVREDDENKRKQRLTPLSNAVTAQGAARALLPGMGTERTRNLLLDSGLPDVLPQGMDERGIRGYVDPEGVWGQQDELARIRAREAGQGGGGSSRSVVSALDADGNPTYFSIDPRTGQAIKIGGVTPAPANRRDYTTQDETALETAAMKMYELEWFDGAGQKKEDAPSPREYVNEYKRERMAGNGGGDQKAETTIDDVVNGLVETAKDKAWAEKMVASQWWAGFSDQEKDAVYDGLRKKNLKTHDLLLSAAKKVKPKTKVAAASGATKDPLGRDYVRPSKSVIKGAVAGGNRLLPQSSGSESTRVR